MNCYIPFFLKFLDFLLFFSMQVLSYSQAYKIEGQVDPSLGQLQVAPGCTENGFWRQYL